MSECFIKLELTVIEETYCLIGMSGLKVKITAIIMQLHNMTKNKLVYYVFKTHC